MRVARKEVGLRLGLSVEVTAANISFSYSGGLFWVWGWVQGSAEAAAWARPWVGSFACIRLLLCRCLGRSVATVARRTGLRVLVPPLSPLLGPHGGGPRTSRRVPRPMAWRPSFCYIATLSLQDIDLIDAETWVEENVPSGEVVLAEGARLRL